MDHSKVIDLLSQWYSPHSDLLAPGFKTSGGPACHPNLPDNRERGRLGYLRERGSRTS